MNDFCQQQGFSAWFETSAKDNINIDESANFLVSKVIKYVLSIFPYYESRKTDAFS